jgi:hypothetical protein
MGIPFPSLALFEALKKRLSEDPASFADVEGSDVYCGLAIGDRLFVFEFDGKECVATVQGGNPLDLDFVLAGPEATWRTLFASIVAGDGNERLSERVEQGSLEIRADDAEAAERASAALPFLEAFLGLGRGLPVEFQ